MKERSYVISRKAVSDLEDIWIYTAEKWSLEQADRYYKLIFEEIDYICKNPDAGKSMEHVRKGYRASKGKSHLIFYKLTKEKMEIVRILHEAMDIENRLGD
jgi:toxin ParE1/3/4